MGTTYYDGECGKLLTNMDFNVSFAFVEQTSMCRLTLSIQNRSSIIPDRTRICLKYDFYSFAPPFLIWHKEE